MPEGRKLLTAMQPRIFHGWIRLRHGEPVDKLSHSGRGTCLVGALEPASPRQRQNGDDQVADYRHRDERQRMQEDRIGESLRARDVVDAESGNDQPLICPNEATRRWNCDAEVEDRGEEDDLLQRGLDPDGASATIGAEAEEVHASADSSSAATTSRGERRVAIQSTKELAASRRRPRSSCLTRTPTCSVRTPPSGSEYTEKKPRKRHCDEHEPVKQAGCGVNGSATTSAAASTTTSHARSTTLPIPEVVGAPMCAQLRRHERSRLADRELCC